MIRGVKISEPLFFHRGGEPGNEDRDLYSVT